MKRLIIPIVIALLAGIGGGSGYAYMHTSPVVADSAAHDSTGTDSTKHGAGKDSTAASSHDSAARAATDSLIVDSMHATDSATAAGAGHATAALPLTPADSIRALQTARATIKSETSASHQAPARAAAAAKVTEATAGPRGDGKLAATPGSRDATTREVAEVVRSARNDALNTALPEERLAKIFGAMQAKDAARVLEQMSDSDIRGILGLMSDRQAAAIIATLPAQRAATITKGAMRAPGSTP